MGPKIEFAGIEKLKSEKRLQPDAHPLMDCRWISCGSSKLPLYTTGSRPSSMDVVWRLSQERCFPDWASVLTATQFSGRGQFGRTWNTAFLAVTRAFQRGGEEEVRHLLWIMESMAATPEGELSDELKKERLILYRESNDALRDLLMGRFGRLPLGFPPEWVYESVFGDDYRRLLDQRTEASPLPSLADADFDAERLDLVRQIEREPTDEELVMYLNHPGDALKTINFRMGLLDAY
jgi:hypothetical protein